MVMETCSFKRMLAQAEVESYWWWCRHNSERVIKGALARGLAGSSVKFH